MSIKKSPDQKTKGLSSGGLDLKTVGLIFIGVCVIGWIVWALAGC